jgi:hypothetical protein
MAAARGTCAFARRASRRKRGPPDSPAHRSPFSRRPGALYPRELTERPYSGGCCPLLRTIRTIKQLEIGAGTTEIRKLIIARELLTS